MCYRIACIALAPLLLVQARRVRRDTPRLPRPSGSREGVDGEGPTLRLMVVGDSAALGVGAERQDDALAGQTVSRLAATFRVDWSVHAAIGATTADTVERLRRLEAEPVDVVVASAGLNDITAGIRAGEFRRRQAELISTLRQRFAAPDLLISGIPPAHVFPALPQPLRWCLGRRATEFHRDLARQVEAEPDCHFLDLRAAVPTSDAAATAEWMASDGFHPGPKIYAAWGRMAADRILELRR